MCALLYACPRYVITWPSLWRSVPAIEWVAARTLMLLRYGTIPEAFDDAIESLRLKISAGDLLENFVVRDPQPGLGAP